MEAGDATAKAVVDNWIEYVACGISNVVNTFEPEAICIGGGVSNQGETLLAPIRKYVEEETKKHYHRQNARYSCLCADQRCRRDRRGSPGKFYLSRL